MAIQLTPSGLLIKLMKQKMQMDTNRSFIIYAIKIIVN